MPERSEVRLMADYINQFSHLEFNQIEKSPESKLKDPAYKGTPFKITASSRGKELRLKFSNDLEDMSMSMGMSGSWAFLPFDHMFFPKHAHIRFIGGSSDIPDTICSRHALCMVDVRRFAKYKWVPKNWTSPKGFDPVDEHSLFYQKLLFASGKSLDAKLNEVLLDQNLFNGVGNYLRAEILFRLGCNPFITLREIIFADTTKFKEDPLLKLCKLVKECMNESYILGGGQIKDFKNPFDVSPDGFRSWLKVYNKGANVIDNTGRRFWFNPIYSDIANKLYAKPENK